MLIDWLIYGVFVFSVAKLLNATLFKLNPPSFPVTWGLTTLMFAVNIAALSALKVLRYKAISANVGVSIEPQNRLDISAALIFAWLFFSVLRHGGKNKPPITTTENPTTETPIIIKERRSVWLYPLIFLVIILSFLLLKTEMQERKAPFPAPLEATITPSSSSEQVTNAAIAAERPSTTVATHQAQPPQQQYTPIEIVERELSEIDSQFKARWEAMNGPAEEIIEGYAEFDFLQADKLTSIDGITEQKAKLKTLSAAIQQRGRNAEVLSQFEADQFARVSKINNLSPNVASTFNSLREDTWRADHAFTNSKARLFIAIEAVLNFAVGKNITTDGDGKIIFQWPLLTAEYEKLMLEVHAAKADSNFNPPSQMSVSAMTLDRLSQQ